MYGASESSPLAEAVMGWYAISSLFLVPIEPGLMSFRDILRSSLGACLMGDLAG